MLTLGKWAFALSSTIFKIWKPFPENPIRQLIANGHPKPYTKQYKTWVQKNTFWHPPYSSANKNQTSMTLWHLPHFSTSILSFYRPDFCLFRLQLCTSWSSPISATTSTFVLVCPFGPDFRTSAFACTTFVLSDYNFYNVRFRINSLNHSRFNVSVSFNTFGGLDFASAFSPFWHFVLSLLTSLLSPDSFPFRLSSFTFLSSIDLFFNFLFVSSRSIQFRRTPKSRRCDPCSKGFREVTHQLLYFEVC